LRSKILIVTLLILVSTLPMSAQEPQMTPEQQKMMAAMEKAGTPGNPHKMLDPMVGTFDTQMKFWAEPGAPPMESSGTSENRWIFGGRYVEQRFKGDVMGQPFEGIGYTGYDNIKKQYFGTWMDSMSTGMMLTTGTATKGGKNWTFKGKMDDPLTGKAVPVEERITIVDSDRHIFEMWTPPMKGGKPYKSMEIVYTRKR
jgi:hypothetical protein